MKNQLLAFSMFVLILTGCSENNARPATGSNPVDTSAKSPADAAPETSRKAASAEEIMNRKQVPILCYHHIRDLQLASKANRGYEVTVAAFKAQMKALADSGYKTVLPDQLYDYLVYGTPLPEKPVMLTYDDTDEEQFSIAKHEMDKYGFKGVYFIMTISIGRPRYMTREQIRQLSDEGHVIASHTWDHNRVDRYKFENTVEIGGRKKVVNDWDLQLGTTKQKLEEITGKPVEYFAYPFGIWAPEGIPEIRKRGYKMAFQLSTQRDPSEPLFTVRRMIVSPEWSTSGLLKVMRSTFR
ncbi:MAG TPA: polysaccharide deacetylase family protein [Flavisolibacter sp.]